MMLVRVVRVRGVVCRVGAGDGVMMMIVSMLVAATVAAVAW